MINGVGSTQMTKRNVLLDEWDRKQYESPKHAAIARSIALGDVPAEADWTWQQRAAVVAYLDGAAEPHDKWLVKITDCGHGHREAIAVKQHVDPWRTLCRMYFDEKRKRGEGDRDDSIERASRRAKQKVRQLCKALGCDSLGTLTYRDNVTDRPTVLKHWKQFVARVRKVLPAFDYVATIEKQARGALHIHMAMRRLPARLWLKANPITGQRAGWVKSWDVMRAIWRRVIGGSGGNFDENKRAGRGAYARCMRIAGYVGKYVAKDFAEGELNSRRYMASSMPQPTVSRQWHDVAVLPELVASIYSGISADLIDCSTWLSKTGDMLWISAYAPPVGPPLPGMEGI